MVLWPLIVALLVQASSAPIHAAPTNLCAVSRPGNTWSCVWDPAVKQTKNPRHLNKSARIAIIGGGVSGVSAAETLTKNGFTNVVVYESGSTVVPLQHAVRTADHVFDMDLIYVPALSWAGSGIEPRYEAVLREYEQELVPVAEFASLSREEWHLNSSCMRQVDGRQVPELHEHLDLRLDPVAGRKQFYEVQRFFHDYGGFFQKNQYRGIQACLTKGIAFGNETFHEWAMRKDYEILFETVAQVLNLYGNFPVVDSPACQVLMLLANKMPSILGGSFMLVASQPDFGKWAQESPLGPSVHDTMLLWFAQIAIEMPTFMRRFKHGYGDLFTTIVLKNRIDYRTNSRVQRLVPIASNSTGAQVQVHFTAPSMGPELFDYVFVAGRPDQVDSLLPHDHPMKPLYSIAKEHAEQTTNKYGVYGVAILSFDVSPLAGFVAKNRFVIDHQKHHVPMFQGNLSAVVNLLRMTKNADAKILTVVFQTRTATVGTSLEQELLFEELSLYGFYDLQVLKMVHYLNTPTRVPVSAISTGWYEQAEAAQGHQQLYFIGEAFSGHGVPTTFMHTRDWLAKTFHLLAFPPPAPSSSSGQVTTNSWDKSVQSLVVNVSADLTAIGTQTYMAMLRRPLEAIRLGIHPVLLVDSPYDTGMPPVAFIFTLSLCMALLQCFGRSFVVKKVEWTKKKNVAIYCTEIVVSCLALRAITDGCTEILMGQLPADFLRATRRASLAGMLMNGMYMCELVYNPRLRRSLQLHHSACIVLYVVMLLCFSQHKATVVLQMGVYNVMNAVTEQTVFLFILLHRVAPALLRSVPAIGFCLTLCYAVTRVLFNALALYAWIQFATDDALLEARAELYGSIALVVYPILTLVQIVTQYECFTVQLGLARRYGSPSDENGNDDAEEEEILNEPLPGTRVRCKTI